MSDGPLLIKADLRTDLATILFLFVLAGLCGAIAMFGFEGDMGTALIGQWASAVASAAFTVAGTVWSRRLFDHKPRLEIDDKGLVDRTWLGRDLTLGWEDVVRVGSSGGFMTLATRMERRDKLPVLRRAFARLSTQRSDVDLVIPLRGLRGSALGILEAAKWQSEQHTLGSLRRMTEVQDRIAPEGTRAGPGSRP